MAPPRALPRTDDRYLRWIGSLQLAKGLLLMAFAGGLLGFLDKDIDAIVGNWITEMGLSPENPHIAAFLAKLDLVTNRQLEQWSTLTFCFSGMFLTEGTGLLLRRQWAKYLTIIATATFIPFEAYAVVHRFGLMKLAILVVNLAVVWLLLILLRREQRRAGILPSRQAGPPDIGTPEQITVG